MLLLRDLQRVYKLLKVITSGVLLLWLLTVVVLDVTYRSIGLAADSAVNEFFDGLPKKLLVDAVGNVTSRLAQKLIDHC